MILITLIENAFKHGVMSVAGKSWIKMVVECVDERINIEIRNGWKNKRNGHGIGLENLRSQLEHLYGKKFELLMDDNNLEEFGVKLIIKESNEIQVSHRG